MNLNAMAKRLTLAEGLREAISIAQVKEVLRLTLDELALMEPGDLCLVLNKRRKQLCKRKKG